MAKKNGNGEEASPAEERWALQARYTVQTSTGPKRKTCTVGPAQEVAEKLARALSRTVRKG